MINVNVKSEAAIRAAIKKHKILKTCTASFVIQNRGRTRARASSRKSSFL
jgi:hypothetical protein